MPGQPNITVLGAGYVGLTTACLFASIGHRVYLVEPNPQRLKTIKSGKSFFYEAGLDPLVAHTVKNGSLVPTDSYADSVSHSKFIFSCVGTPDNPDGSSDLAYVFAAAQQAAKCLSDEAIYIQKSTVPVGTGQKVSQLLPKNVAYVSNPEFLREGTALGDSLYFDRVVVGSQNQPASQAVLELYKKLAKNRSKVATIANIPAGKIDGKYIATNLDSAELIKVTANAFLALKISFANSIAKLADQTGANINQVMDGVGADQRIGRPFLNAGRGYGGGCFPKDVSGLIASAKDHRVDLSIMQAASDVNESMAGYIVSKIQAIVSDDLKAKKIAILGLAFKPGTSDCRRSSAVELANLLAAQSAAVSAYDPKANQEARTYLDPKVNLASSIDLCADQADLILVATAWPEFLNLDLGNLQQKMRGNLFVDAMNCFNPESVQKQGFDYIGVGAGRKVNKNHA